MGKPPAARVRTMKATALPKRERRPMSNEEKTKITMDRFAPLRQGRGPEAIATLGQRYRRNPAMITRAIVGAFKAGLVEVVPTTRPQFVRDESMSDKVLRRYPDLWQALVIETDSPSEDKEETRRRVDDDVHRKLGYAMAKSIRDWRVGGGDKIGFGSGRAVYFTVEAAKQLPHPALWVKDLDLVSLTGAVHARDHANVVNARMDADFHVGSFGSCVQGSATLHLVSYPITAGGQRKLTCLGAEQWGKCRPTHAIVGIGVLAAGHRFVELARQRDSQVNPVYRTLLGPLRTLVDLCEQVSRKYHYCPVADICNQLILIENPELPAGLRDRIREGMDGVNRLLLNVAVEQLGEIPNLLIVAGGKRKSGALRQILSSPGLNVRIVCIDQALASELVQG
jgi:hypothetical protein